ncbi:GGDEF domain-containing protein [Pleionea sediminis]|uniref:GGDEF domain-containing protein n=1 Tax=Pleionea sediminis TaxID=2569479 RepID=UPI00118724F3|nr:GGDEF domain-containing protein [Pleionea sediminis]
MKQWNCISKLINSIKFILLFFCFGISNSLLSSDNIRALYSPPIGSSPVLDGQWTLCFANGFKPYNNLSKCHPFKIPGSWEEQGYEDYDGFVRLSKLFFLSEEQTKDYTGIYFHKIRDADKVYINGHLIGETGEFPPDFKKATLYSRTYSIDPDVWKINDMNRIDVWIYNNARMGGITNEAPVLDNYYNLLKKQTYSNYETIAFVSVLAVFALLHLVYFAFHRHSFDVLFYGIFVGTWSVYLLTYTEIILDLNFDLNFIFRLNIALFYIIFISLPLFIFKFYNEPVPKYLTLVFAFVALNIPFVLLVPNIDHIYLSLTLIETVALLVTLPAIIYIIYQSYKRQLDYSRYLNAFVILYLFLGTLDIYFDFTKGAPDVGNRLLGPYALIILNFAFSAIVYHKHWVYYQGATFDTLTGLLQREPFIERLTQDLYRFQRNEQRLIIIMLDLDRFKSINDTFGHMAGDDVLRAVANGLTQSLRTFDNVARFGGDEFCISALVDKDTHVESFVERIHQAISNIEIEVKGVTIKPAATFGALEYHSTFGDDPEQLITMADDQLITAKFNDKGSILWFKEPLLSYVS